LHILKYLSLSFLIAVFFISCEKDDSTIIDPILHFPHVDSAYVTPDIFDTSNVNGLAFAKVTSEEAIISVTATVKDPVNFERTFTLRDDGVSPDPTAGDGWYTGTISFAMSCRLVGLYNANFVAQNISNLYSNTFIDNFNVINSNNIKPLLINLVSPDSLQKPSGIGGDTMRGSFLQVQVIDSNGLCDVMETFFNSFKPDGTPSNGNPFRMYDDGSNCDTIPNDGKYSLCIYIFSNAQVGSYTFKYNARDRTLLLSDTLIHHIYVYQ
jgi:hypothetical protein